VKTLRLELAARAANRERFFGEAEAVAAVEHDHVVPIYHVGEDRGVPFLVTPFLRGDAGVSQRAAVVFAGGVYLLFSQGMLALERMSKASADDEASGSAIK
jgi:hypothetical protein